MAHKKNCPLALLSIDYFDSNIYFSIYMVSKTHSINKGMHKLSFFFLAKQSFLAFYIARILKAKIENSASLQVLQ